METSRHRVSYIIRREGQHEPHERISHIAGINSESFRWSRTQEFAIKSMEDKKYAFFVLINGQQIDLEIATHNGHKYLKTKTDGYSPDNLLALPDCPK